MLKGVVFRKSHRLAQNWFSHRGGDPLPPEGAFPFPTRAPPSSGPTASLTPAAPCAHLEEVSAEAKGRGSQRQQGRTSDGQSGRTSGRGEEG